MIYLDNNATTPLRDEVLEAMISSWRSGPANPSSQHRWGRRAARVMEDAREAIAELLGADAASLPSDRVIFTSGGTEANNLAILGLNRDTPGKVVISAIEHPSVSHAARELARRGVPVEILRVLPTGVVDLAHLAELLAQSPTRLVSVMLVNNETGVIQPLAQVAELCSQAGVPLHTDAVQAVGKLPVNFRSLGVAAMTIAPHKFHGPVGIGALLVRHDAALSPILFGGTQQLGVRPGTESTALVVGMRTALELSVHERESRSAVMKQLRDSLESRLLAGWPGAVVLGGDAPRAPHTTNIAFPPVDRQAAIMALDMAGVACSTGSACASGSSEPSPVLLAMGVSADWVRSALRFSVSAMNTCAEIENAAERILQVLRNLQRSSS